MTINRYILGYLVSLALTLAAVAVVLYAGGPQYVALSALALLQLMAQLYFFLHVGQDPRQKLNTMALCLALVVVFILIGGTLWIMDNLSQGHMQAGQPFINDQITVQNEND